MYLGNRKRHALDAFLQQDYKGKKHACIASNIVGKAKRDERAAKAEKALDNERYGWKANIDGFCL